MKNHLSSSVFFLLLFLFCPYVYASDIYYVNDDAAGSNTGEDWTNAFNDFQEALDQASIGDKIWVASGTYYPSVEHGGSGERYRSFQMINRVSIYGGFNGTETVIEQRDIQVNPTILSGDIGVVGDNSDNCYHVFYHPSGLNLDETALLDGFTITGGKADGSGNFNYGGGMYNHSCSPTLTNCTLSGNMAGYYGGGMFNHSCSPTLTNCNLNGNSTNFGGGMYNYSSSPTLTNCKFRRNGANSHGGGMYNESSSLTLKNCVFNGNGSGYGGGGMCNYDSQTMVNNCTFSGNMSTNGGGMHNLYYSQPSLTNCTFSSNVALVNGGGIYNSNSSPTLTNCIMWENNSAIYNDNSSPSVSYCNIQGSGGSGSSWDDNCGTDGGGNIDDDPMFMRNPSSGYDDSEWGTEDDDYGDLHLRIGSPCIDAGDNDAILGITEDLDGELRIIHGTVDMGAYEYRPKMVMPCIPLLLLSD